MISRSRSGHKSIFETIQIIYDLGPLQGANRRIGAKIPVVLSKIQRRANFHLAATAVASHVLFFRLSFVIIRVHYVQKMKVMAFAEFPSKWNVGGAKRPMCFIESFFIFVALITFVHFWYTVKILGFAMFNRIFARSVHNREIRFQFMK